jgi:hypothetical protein
MASRVGDQQQSCVGYGEIIRGDGSRFGGTLVDEDFDATRREQR